MASQVIPKQADIPAAATVGIQIRRIEYFDPPYKQYEEGEITEKLIAKILTEIPKGINIYLFLNPDGEDDWLEVNCDGEWIALTFSSDGGQDIYYSYNPAFAHTDAEIQKCDYSDKNVYTDLESGGQSPIPKLQAITDIEAGVKAVEYFIRTGKFYPGIDWAHEF